MGDMADLEADSWDPSDWEDWAGLDPFCEYCGSGPFRWVTVEGGGWRLERKDGKLHTCKRYWKAKGYPENKKRLMNSSSEARIERLTALHHQFLNGRMPETALLGLIVTELCELIRRAQDKYPENAD